MIMGFMLRVEYDGCAPVVGAAPQRRQARAPNIDLRQRLPAPFSFRVMRVTTTGVVRAGFGAPTRASARVIMPYSDNEHLPTSVRSRLPPHAQDIYREAFNHAWQQYRRDPRHEEIAHRVAWAAVKRRYRKVGTRWAAIER
jgi:cation transport regulator